MLKQKKLIGMQICADGVKMVKSNGAGGIISAGSAAFMPGVFADGRIQTPSLVVEGIRAARQAGKIHGKACALCLSGGEGIIRYFTFPDMEDALLQENVLHEISGYLPVAPEEYIIDYRIVETQQGPDGDNLRVMVAAISRQRVEEMVDCVRHGGLEVRYVDILEIALEKMMYYHHISASGNYIAAELGGDAISIYVYASGRFFISRVLNHGFLDLYAEIAKELGKEESIIARDVWKSDIAVGQDPLGNRVAQFLDTILDEISRLMEYFHSRHDDQTMIDRLYLCGEHTRIPGVTQYLKTRSPIKAHLLKDRLGGKLKALQDADYICAVAATYREVD